MEEYIKFILALGTIFLIYGLVVRFQVMVLSGWFLPKILDMVIFTSLLVNRFVAQAASNDYIPEDYSRLVNSVLFLLDSILVIWAGRHFRNYFSELFGELGRQNELKHKTSEDVIEKKGESK